MKAVLWNRVPSESEADLVATVLGNERLCPADEVGEESLTWLAGEYSSTFDLAWEAVERNLLSPWSGVMVGAQSRGRGQLRRKWESPSGNMYLTFMLPGHSIMDGPLAPLVLGAVLARGLDSLGVAVRLKWPNDLVVRNPGGWAKFGGILLEQRDTTTLAGVGINLILAPGIDRMRPDAAFPATCLNLSGTSPFALWKTIFPVVRQSIHDLDQADPRSVQREIEGWLALRGDKVAHRDGPQTTIGTLLGISSDGALRILDEEGGVRTFDAGSIFPLQA